MTNHASEGFSMNDFMHVIHDVAKCHGVKSDEIDWHKAWTWYQALPAPETSYDQPPRPA